uniref:Uncharacterized protein n=1 Tax=Arundo donax TaxID=35708 RepID=A0A0A8YLA4_ARUDO
MKCSSEGCIGSFLPLSVTVSDRSLQAAGLYKISKILTQAVHPSKLLPKIIAVITKCRKLSIELAAYFCLGNSVPQ